MTDSGTGARSTATSARRASPLVPLWLVALALVVGIAFLVVSFVSARSELRYRDEGVTVQATITGMRVDTGDADEDDHYYVRWQFVDPATAGTYTGSGEVGAFRYAGLRIGDSIEISFLASEPTSSRLGTPEPQLSLAAALAIFGGLAVLTTPLLLWSWVRWRRSPRAAPGAEQMLEPGRRVDTFTRAPIQAAGGPVAMIAAIGFLALASFGVSQAGNMPSLLMLTLIGTIFGLGLIIGGFGWTRRGLGLKVAEVGPDALWVRGPGRLAWSEIRDLRLERLTRRGASKASGPMRERLGIVPANPSTIRRLPGGLGRRLVGSVETMANEQARREGRAVTPTQVDDAAPFGIAPNEIEQSFDALLASIRRFAPIGERTAEVPADDEESPNVEPAAEPVVDPGPLTDARIRRLDAGLADDEGARPGSQA